MVRKITNELFVGSKLDAEKNYNKFDVIISLEKLPLKYSSREFLINDGKHNYNIFKNAVDYSIKMINNHNKILVHCQAGMSRSVSVCLAVYVVYYGKKYEKAKKVCFNNKHQPHFKLIQSAKRYISEKNNS